MFQQFKNRIYRKGKQSLKNYSFIHKYNKFGNLLYNSEFRWNVGISNNQNFNNSNNFYKDNYNSYNKIKIDSNGNIYVSNSFTDSVVFGKTFLISDSVNTLIAKYDDKLNFLWAKKSKPHSYYSTYQDFTLDDSANIYICGTSAKNLTFDGLSLSKNSSAYIFKFNKDGEAKWAFEADPLVYASAFQLHIDDCGNILARGGYGGLDSVRLGSVIEISYIKFKRLYIQTKLKTEFGKVEDYFLAKYSQHPLKITNKPHCTFDSLVADVEPKYVSFTWQFGNGKILKGKKVAYFADSVGWYHVKLTAVTSKGCVKHFTDSFYFSKPFSADDKTEIYHTTVTSQNTAKIAFKPLLKAVKYNIYRSENGNNSQLISGTKDTIFTDSSADCSTYSYTYKLLAVDRCGNTLEADNHAKTILLQGENHNNQFAEIKWSPYEIWKNGVKEYCIEIKDTAGNWNALNCNKNNNLALRDDDFVDVNNKERCYRIRAIENNGNLQQSLSNELCLPYLPTLWKPNAFSPNNDGLNDTFKILTIALAEYKLTIYNRWGQQVFTSDDLNKNWTGKSGNENLPEGEYIYTLQAKGFNKENIYKQGYILLIR